MTTRRRFLGAMTAIGLMPSAALAQEAEKPVITMCQNTVGFSTDDHIYVEASGPKGVIERAIADYRFQLRPDKFTLSSQVQQLGDGPSGVLNFIMSRPEPARPGVEIENFKLLVRGFIDDTIGPYPDKQQVRVSFMTDDGSVLLSRFGQIERYSSDGSAETAVTFDLNRAVNGNVFPSSSSRTEAKSLFETMVEDDKLIDIVINRANDAPSRLLALFTYTMGDAYVDWLYAYAEQHLTPIANQQVAGTCPAPGNPLLVPCFLTTAASEALGLPDDCWELQTLREFRDGPLMLREGGPELVDRYYAEAPAMVAALPLETHRRLWARSWLFGVLPTALLCRFGAYGLATKLYHKLFDRLSEAAKHA